MISLPKHCCEPAEIWQEIDSSKKLFGMCSQILSNVHGSFSGTQKQEESGWGSPSSRQPCRGCDRWPPKKIAEADSEGPSFRRTGPGNVSTTRWWISRPLPFQAGYGHSVVCWWPCQSTTSSAVCWRIFTESPSTRSAVCRRAAPKSSAAHSAVRWWAYSRSSTFRSAVRWRTSRSSAPCSAVRWQSAARTACLPTC